MTTTPPMPAAASLTFKVYKLYVSLTSTLTFLRGTRGHKESLHQLSAEKSRPGHPRPQGLLLV